jgi:hypothetical protein
MVGSKVDEDVADAVLPERLEEGKGCCVAGGRQDVMCPCIEGLYLHHDVCRMWYLVSLLCFPAGFRVHVRTSPMMAYVGELNTPMAAIMPVGPTGARGSSAVTVGVDGRSSLSAVRGAATAAVHGSIMTSRPMSIDRFMSRPIPSCPTQATDATA